MNSTLIRLISAAVAGCSFLVIYLLWGSYGLGFAISAVTPLAIWEYSKLAFNKINPPLYMKISFLVTAYALYLICISSQKFEALPVWGLLLPIYFSLCLWTCHRKINNEKLLQLFLSSAMGFIYCSLFISFLFRTLTLHQGGIWFLFLLLIVFLGDTFAYFFGRTWGNKKLAPSLSPNKTSVGALGGLLGSLIGAVTINLFLLTEQNLFSLLAIAILTGIVAQSGDLFESLIKRVAGLKDSGKIMPGHGGILDRIDGLVFAAPVFYSLAQLSSYFV